jgi:hypothetical protein
MGVLFFCLASFRLVADHQAPPVYFFSNDCGPLRRVSGALSLAVGFITPTRYESDAGSA